MVVWGLWLLPGASPPDLPENDQERLTNEALNCGDNYCAPKLTIFYGRWRVMSLTGHQFSSIGA